jgi:hypothetical protein
MVQDQHQEEQRLRRSDASVRIEGNLYRESNFVDGVCSRASCSFTVCESAQYYTQERHVFPVR